MSSVLLRAAQTTMVNERCLGRTGYATKMKYEMGNEEKVGTEEMAMEGDINRGRSRVAQMVSQSQQGKLTFEDTAGPEGCWGSTKCHHLSEHRTRGILNSSIVRLDEGMVLDS